MTLAGWLILIPSVGGVTLLFAWCVCKVFTTPDETKRLHGFDSHTPDQ